MNKPPADSPSDQDMYRQLVERASDIIYETDANGYFMYANPVASRLVGRPIEELVGLRFTQLIRDDARLAAEEFYAKQAMTGTATTYYEFPMITAHGGEVWIGQNVQLLTKGREIVGFQAVARDITDRYQTDRFKDELLAVVSHELRTPLTAIRGALGLLQSGRLTPERTDRMLTLALSNADRMTRLLQDFLDLERLRLGHFELELGAAAIADLLAEAAAAVQVMADAAAVTVAVYPVDGEARVDRDRIIQALVNLLTNAIKFSESGTVVELRAERDAEGTRFIVKDNGRGIPSHKLDLIYEPFRQVDQSDSREKGGVGIGLTIMHSIIQLHRGSVQVESEVGRGSTFTIMLPRT